MDKRRETVIIVDDAIANLTAAGDYLDGKYNIAPAASAEQLFQLLESVTPALILLDIGLPEMSGYDVIKALKSKEQTASVPVIFLTDKIDPESEAKGFGLGAADFITKPFSRELLTKRIDLHILFEKQRKELLKHNLSLESEIDKKNRTVLELQNAILKTVAELVERRDNVTGGHIERTQHYLRLLVGFLIEHGVCAAELASWDINLFIMSSQLHDVGKISIRDEILMKPGRLTFEEFEEMKRHTVYGVEIIRKIEKNTSESDFLIFAEIMAGSHHEQWNGKGYPKGLQGDEIPLQGRLMAIVDVYDALTDERPYKGAYTHQNAVEIIRDEMGEHFDPLITEVFLAHEREFEKQVQKQGRDAEHYENSATTFSVISNIISAHGGISQNYDERIARYLKIFMGALLNNERFKEEASAWDAEMFIMSAQLHDVGIIAVADHILKKSDRLTALEYENVKAHADFGIRVIRRVQESVEGDDLMRYAESVAGSHHEKWDGTGYPSGLKGEDIPLQGRIMAIVDVYHALTTDRPHRGKKLHKEAVETIANGAGTHFDPELVRVFLECEEDFKRVLTG